MLSAAAAPAPSLPFARVGPGFPPEANTPAAAASVDRSVPSLAFENVSPTRMEIVLFDLVNGDRALHGLAPVAFDLDLLSLARQRALAQRAELPLTHRNEAGELEFTKGLTALGVAFGAAGENLVRVPFTDARTPAAAHAALMNSQPHRDIVLQPGFERLAVGTAFDGPSTMVFVQIFVGFP